MKRYIIALVALLSLTACKISDGHRPDKNEVDRLLYNRAISTTIYLFITYLLFFESKR